MTAATPARTGLLALAALLLPVALLVPGGPAAQAEAPGGTTTVVGLPGPGATRREQAVEAYRDVQAAQRVRAGWTGSVRGCRVGRESAASRAATRTTVNRLRRLAGIGSITLDPALNAQALAASLMMRANGALDHDPPRSWRCWSRTGQKAAGSSNLALGLSGPRAVMAFASDSGAPTMGHRRWLLNPSATTFGTGSTGSSNALHVFGDSRAVPGGTAVAWPPSGFVPYPWVFPDWTLEVVGAEVDATAAQVTMTVDGAPVTVSGVRELPQYYGPGLGLTWRPTLPRSVRAGDHEVVVTVTGLVVDGETSPVTWTTRTVDVD